MDEQEKLIVLRAKKLLMETLHFTEPQAHRYIEKHAMDMRKKKIEIAKGILKVYEE